jgi:hypothetical protein
MLNGLEETDDHRLFPVLSTFRSSAQIGLEIDRLADGRVVVMVLSSPNPWSGMVNITEAERVQRLDLPMTAYMDDVERLGLRMEELLAAGNYG